MTAAVSLDQAIRARLELVPDMDSMGEDVRFAVDVEMVQAALFAVLGLHKPRPAGIVGKPHLADCAVCLDVGPEVCSPVGYPCETVEAIAEKLGVEVGGA